MQIDFLPPAASRSDPGRYIFIACPWTPKGGGMYKVADYLIQAQADPTPGEAARLRPLDTRGDRNSLWSLWVLSTALARLVRGRLSGELVGVHVNMAERLSLFRKSAVVVVSHALGLPVVLHLHAAQLHHFYRRLPSPLQAFTRWTFSLADQVVVLGSESRRFVAEELRVPAGRIEVLINGVPEPSVTRRRQDDTGNAFQQLLFVGNLSERKGVSDLLKALHALAQTGYDTSRLQVTLAGGGDVQAYEAQARALGIDRWVRFTGWANQTTVAQLMASADLLVLPSFDEGLPLVILEALANGVAVVCTPVGEIPSVLTDGANACFVTPGDVSGMAHVLRQLLLQPTLRQTLERNGRAIYRQQFSLGRFFSGVASIHQRHFGIAAVPCSPAVNTARAGQVGCPDLEKSTP